jgi:hypothetical protein
MKIRYKDNKITIRKKNIMLEYIVLNIDEKTLKPEIMATMYGSNDENLKNKLIQIASGIMNVIEMAGE